MIIPLEIAKELKNLSDEFENLNDRDRLRYFIQESLMQEYSSNLNSTTGNTGKKHNGGNNNE